MQYYKPDRDIVRRAIALCKESNSEKYSGNTILACPSEESVSTDAAILLISIINRRRAKLDKEKSPYDLKELVTYVCARAPFEEDRVRAYELVIMRFFLLMKDHVRQWREERRQ
jgi:hypothetical protein